MAARGFDHDKTPTPTSSGTSEIVNVNTPGHLSASWSVPTSVSHAVTGLLRRFSADPPSTTNSSSLSFSHPNKHPKGQPPAVPLTKDSNDMDVYTPPYRTASPFHPPPLYPVSLRGYKTATPASARLLTRALAEEIRLLVPPRLQLCEEWSLVYSLDEDGVSLGTLYKKCDDLRGLRNGFVLIVKDGENGLFGAYLTEAPHPSPHYYGTGECFLWRASVLSPSDVHASLPPPPSTDTTNLQRSTTISSSSHPTPISSAHLNRSHAHSNTSLPTPSTPSFPPRHPTPDHLRFKAFPYSGINDYMMLCEPGFLSVGGGDGHYGLWLDDTFEKGISSACLTFGNEPLSDEGEKFDILGVEIWSIGNS